MAQLGAEASARQSDDALEALAACLGNASKGLRRRALDALVELARVDDRILPLLRRLIERGEPLARWAAAYALGRIEGTLDGRARELLLEGLASEDRDLRWAVADLLVNLDRKKDSTEIPRALLTVAHQSSPVARKMALYCLRDLGYDDAGVHALAERALKDASPQVRLAALSLLPRLAALGRRRAELALYLLESDSSPGVRRAAASTLGRLAIGSPQVLEALKRAACDPDGSLRRAARGALSKLGGP